MDVREFLRELEPSEPIRRMIGTDPPRVAANRVLVTLGTTLGGTILTGELALLDYTEVVDWLAQQSPETIVTLWK